MFLRRPGLDGPAHPSSAERRCHQKFPTFPRYHTRFTSPSISFSLQAIQFAFLIMLPSVLLSGFMFPRSEMPLPIYILTFAIPVTYFLEILRGIVLRGADFIDLLPHVIGLIICCLVILGLSLSRFRKQLA